MMVGVEERVADEATSFAFDTELHGKVLHFIVIGLGSEVAMAVDEGIGPALYLF